MEDPTLTVKRAIKFLKIADHMLTQTYPLVNDPKLLIVIMENVFLSLSNGMTSILELESLKSRQQDYKDDFASKYKLFLSKFSKKYDISKEDLSFIGDVYQIIEEHKKSPVEFVRKDTFVICSQNYRISTIKLKKMSEFIKKAKTFINKVDGIIDKNMRKGQ